MSGFVVSVGIARGQKLTDLGCSGRRGYLERAIAFAESYIKIG